MIDLREYDGSLDEVYVILGRNLCSHVYVISPGITLIDLGSSRPKGRLGSEFQRRNWDLSQVSRVFLTHTHMDHMGGIYEVLQYAKPDVYVHTLDSEPVNWISSTGATLKLLEGGEIIGKELPLEVIHTPGHTPGSICLYQREIGTLFSGDTVFAGGFGRTDLEGGDQRRIVNSLGHLIRLSIKNLLAGHMDLAIGDGMEHVRAAYESAKRLLGYHTL